MGIEKLSSEWTHEEIVDACRRWCIANGLHWDATLEWRSRDELFEMFLTPTGKYGGVIHGHKLIYTNQQKVYVLDDKKLRMRLDKRHASEAEELRRRQNALAASKSAGQSYHRNPRQTTRRTRGTERRRIERLTSGIPKSKFALSPSMMSLTGLRTEMWRITREVSIADLCASTGISVNTYKNFLMGSHRLTGREIANVATKLGISVRTMVRYFPDEVSDDAVKHDAIEIKPTRSHSAQRTKKTKVGTPQKKEEKAYDPDEAAKLLEQRFKGKVSRW